jgi:hypothetical protein
MIRTNVTIIAALCVFACLGGGAAQLHISQLEGLDIAEGLKQFIGSLVTEIAELKKKKKDTLCKKTQVVQTENVAL